MNMLSLLKKLIDNYDRSFEMKNNILAHKIHISKCKENANIEDLVTYYDEYNIIEKKKINIKCIKTITGHTLSIESLLLLKDKRIASCSSDRKIRIYNPSNDYKCDEKIRRHSEGIESICELDDGTIVSSSSDKSIMIGDYTIKNAHDECIYKVITLPNNRIASCSDDETIKIWKSTPPYSDTPIKVLGYEIMNVFSLLYIKERDILISGSDDDRLRLWNMSTYKLITVLDGVYCCSFNSLFQIDKDSVIIGGFDKFFIVNIDKCVIEKTIKVETLGCVHCFIKLRDKTILCGCGKGIYCFYDEYRRI